MGKKQSMRRVLRRAYNAQIHKGASHERALKIAQGSSGLGLDPKTSQGTVVKGSWSKPVRDAEQAKLEFAAEQKAAAEAAKAAEQEAFAKAAKQKAITKSAKRKAAAKAAAQTNVEVSNVG